MQFERKEKFTLRKSKKYKNLVSVGLGVVTAVALGMAVDNEAHASEAEVKVETTQNPATNEKEAQKEATKEQKENLINENKAEGKVDINLDSTILDKAVEKAKSEGIKVNKKEDKDLGITTSTKETEEKQKEVELDYKKQAEKITSEIDKYKEEKEEVKKKQEETIEYNKKEKEKNEREIAKYNEEKEKIEKENTNKKAKYLQEVKTYEEAEEKYRNKVEELKQKDKASEEEYQKALAEYLKDIKKLNDENTLINTNNEAVRKRNEDNQKKYEEALKQYKKQEEKLKQDLENEKQVIIEAGGERKETEKGVGITYAEKIEVEARGKVEVKEVNWYETKTNSELLIKLPNTEIKNGAYIDIKYERLREVALKDSDVHAPDGTVIGMMKLVEISHLPHSARHVAKEEQDGQDEMHNYHYRLIFNDKVNKYLNREIRISTKDTLNWNGFYSVEKQGVKHTIYVNGKEVAQVTHSIPAMHKENERDKNKLYIYFETSGAQISPDGEIRPEMIKFGFHNSSPRSDGRSDKFEVGDVFTIKVDPNNPIKFDSSKKIDKDNLLRLTAINFGHNHNRFGTLIPLGEVPNIEILNFTDTELKFKLTKVSDDFFNIIEDTGSALPMKITSYNKDDYRKDRKYRYYMKVEDVNGRVKTEVDTRNRVYTGGADIDSVGELRPYVPKSNEQFKIKVNYIDEAGNVLKAPYKENDLAYGDKYKVNVQKIKDYVFVKEQDKKVLNGTFESDVEYTLVYKKVIKPTEPNKPTVEKEQPTIPNNLTPPEKPKSSELPPKPTPPVPEKPDTPLPPKPSEPKYKEIPQDPKIPTVEYNYYKLAEQPQVEKTVKNSENQDVNKGLVNKMSTVKFELKTEKLPAGREKLTVFEITDNLPQGYKLDEIAVKEENPQYEIMYDKEKHVLVLKAKQQLLEEYNKNLGLEVEVITPVVIGTVLNDGATYKNNFRLNLNNKYTKYSNTVVVTTPGKPNDPENPNNNLIKPEKHNENKDGVVIDGKTLLPKTENYYKLLWDLDQYQDIKVSKEDIAKGFFYVDDYPEEALELNANGITLVDSKGQEVKGVKIESFESLEKTTSEVKSTLEKAGIKPKGAFQLFIAENPEEFFNDYVVTGNSIIITSPMMVKEGFTGEYENKAYQIDFGNGYETEIVKNNIVINPKPEKHNENKDGVVIDGKTLLPKTENYYKLLWDLDQYKDVKVNKEDIAKGFFYVDDYPEEALELNTNGITLVDSKGQEVKGVKVESFESLEKATSEVKSALEKAGINPKGAFQLFIAENPEQFFKDYVVTGNSITITSPMTVKEAFSGEYENKAYQVDFGMGYETEVVVNNVPKITPEKDVVIDVMDKNSLDGKTIELNTVFNYHLVGGKLPANRGVEITQYGFSDDYDETGDKYDGNYKVFATVDITLKDGTVIKRDTEITEHTTQTHENGKVEIELNKDFLEKISNDSEFQADVYLQMTRVQAGEFENTFENTINGVKTISNTVKTKTPEQPSEPEEPQKTLPNTGLDNNEMTTVGLGLLMSAALLARKKQKQK